jgi:hypothetical protein
MTARFKKPSIGFLLVVAVYSAALLFGLWGIHRPDLDHLWFLKHELRVGRHRLLDPSDVKVLFRALDRHPGLAGDFLNGSDIDIISANSEGVLETETAYILRAKESPAKVMTISCHGADGVWPVQVSLHAMWREGRRKMGDWLLTSPGERRILLDASAEHSLLEMRFTAEGDLAGPSFGPSTALTMRVTFETQP